MIHNIRTCTCWDCQTQYLQIEAEPSDPLESAIERFIRLLAEEGIPLTAPVTVAAVLEDLCDLGDIPTPLAVRAAVRQIV